MIHFPCRCAFEFSLEDDQAGGMVQCPRCGLLNDVPRHDEIASLAEDGTYELDPTPPASGPQTAEELAYLYSRGTYDLAGNEKDLRLRDEELDVVGGEPIPLADDVVPREHAPKYDPESGQLIEPLDFSDGPGEPKVNPASIPMAKAALVYASGETARRPWLRGTFLHLLTPANLAVMFGVLFMHVLLWPVVFITFMGLAFFIMAIPIIIALLFAHYGNVIEEAGPCENDELPRPLRNLEFYDDIWSPFCNMFASLVLCYGPALALSLTIVRIPALQSVAVGILVTLAGVGTFFVPAVMLTLQGSGSILNLRPDRVMACIGACGKGYFVAVVFWIVGGGMYLWGCLGTSLALYNSYSYTTFPFIFQSWTTTFPALLLGIYLAHCYCVWLGMLYRAHYEQFPWVLQKHVREPREAPPLPLPLRTGQAAPPQGNGDRPRAARSAVRRAGETAANRSAPPAS